MKWETVYLGLGSNKGARLARLRRAVALLGKHPQVEIGKLSRVYETAPVGPDQAKFFNAALSARTPLSASALLALLKKTEKKLGRKKTFKWGPREIDLDILFYGRKRIKKPGLTVPHPEFHKRRFVLVPLRDIAPKLKAPGFSQTVGGLCLRLTDPRQKVRLLPSKLR